MKANVRKRSFAIRTINQSVGVPSLFAILFWAAYPPLENQPSSPSLVPAAVILTLAVGGWFFVLWTVLRVIRAGVRWGSGWAAVSVVPLVAYAYGLVAAWWALAQR